MPFAWLLLGRDLAEKTEVLIKAAAERPAPAKPVPSPTEDDQKARST